MAAPLASLPPRAADLAARILERNPMHRGFLERAVAQLSPDEAARWARYLDFAQAQGLTPDHLAECYLTVVGDALREQVYFRRHGRYRHSRFAEVAARVYDDPEFMHRYMYGLAITVFLWPNHLAMARFFERTMPRHRGGAYLEIGPGHGYYLMTAVASGAYDNVRGIDVSAASVAQTRAVLEHFCPEHLDRYHIEQRDFLDATDLPPESADAVVMGEVLEHVEQPDVFLRRIADVARPDAFIFVTTCVNAPAIDHIFLWRSPEEVDALVRACGLEIVESLRLPYEGKTLEACAEERLTVNLAYVLRKASATSAREPSAGEREDRETAE